MISECTVAVLLSSYNGEKYIREQIDSILGQTWKNIKIYVRDDGSSDKTAEILRKYEQEGKLVFYQGENIGFINSFFDILKRCGKADYYAWCDQDDVWLPGKIERALERLETDREAHTGKKDQNRPVLYFSEYDFYDENLHFLKHGLVHKEGPSFANSLLDCISLGFNSVFNDCTRKMMLRNKPEHCCGHDWWTYMVCAAFGRVIYDKGYVSVKYRRLGNSTSPGGKNFIALQIWRFRKFFLNQYFKNIREQLREFADIYYSRLNGSNRKLIRLFVLDRYSLRNALMKTFYPVRFRQGIMEELMVRVLFLIGQL